MGFTTGGAGGGGHTALAPALIGGESVRARKLVHVHRGERAALEHAIATGGPLRFLLVDTTPIEYAITARMADAAVPVPQTAAALRSAVLAALRAELLRLGALGLAERSIFCWDGPNVALIKKDTTSKRMQAMATGLLAWQREAAEAAPREAQLRQHATHAAMAMLSDLYTPEGVAALVADLPGHVTADEDAVAGSAAPIVHVVAHNEADLLIARLSRSLGHGESSAVLSIDSDMLVHALDAYRWVVRAVPLEEHDVPGAPPPEFHWQHLFDRNRLAHALNTTWSAAFGPHLDEARVLAFVALCRTDYGNGLHRIGPKQLINQRQLANALLHVGARPLLAARVHAIIERVGHNHTAAEVAAVQRIADVYLLAEHGATETRAKCRNEATRAAAQARLGFRDGSRLAHWEEHPQEHRPVVPPLRAPDHGNVGGKALGFKQQVSRAVLSHKPDILVPRTQGNVPTTHLTPKRPAPDRVFDKSKQEAAKSKKPARGSTAVKLLRKTPKVYDGGASTTKIKDSTVDKETMTKHFGLATHCTSMAALGNSGVSEAHLRAVPGFAALVSTEAYSNQHCIVVWRVALGEMLKLQPGWLTCSDATAVDRLRHLFLVCRSGCSSKSFLNKGMAAPNGYTNDEFAAVRSSGGWSDEMVQARRAVQQAGYVLPDFAMLDKATPNVLAAHIFGEWSRLAERVRGVVSSAIHLRYGHNKRGRTLTKRLWSCELPDRHGRAQHGVARDSELQALLSQRDAHVVAARRTLEDSAEGGWDLTLDQIMRSARGTVTLHLLQGWAEALSGKALLSGTAAPSFVGIFTRSSLGHFFRFGAKRLAAFASWIDTNSTLLRAAADSERLARCGVVRHPGRWALRPDLPSICAEMQFRVRRQLGLSPELTKDCTSFDKAAMDSTLHFLETALDMSARQAWGAMGMGVAWVPTGTVTSDGASMRWYYCNLTRPVRFRMLDANAPPEEDKYRVGAPVLSECAARLAPHQSSMVWRRLQRHERFCGVQVGVRRAVVLPLPSNEDFTGSPAARTSANQGALSGTTSRKNTRLAIGKAQAAGRPVMHVGVDPGINNIVTMARFVDMEPGTYYTCPDGTHPDGRAPLTADERVAARLPPLAPTRTKRSLSDELYGATDEDRQRWRRLQAVALKKETMTDQCNWLASEIAKLRRTHDAAAPVGVAARHMHAAAFEQSPAVSALRDELRRVKKRQLQLAVDAILEWLVMREGVGLMSQRFQTWGSRDALVVVHVGNWKSTRRPGLAGQTSSVLLRECMRQARLRGLPIVWRLQDEFMTSQACPSACTSTGRKIDSKKNLRGEPQRLSGLRRRFRSRAVRDIKHCTSCHRTYARDVAAAVNIMLAGLHQLRHNCGAFRPPPPKPLRQ